MSFVRALGRSDAGVICFTVHEPPNPPADRLDRAESLVFVKEGFTYMAAALTPLWLLFKRQWLAFLLYLVALVTITLALLALDAPPLWILAASSGLHLLVGFEADAIQRWTLGRRGFRMIGTVTGRTETDCERRFLENWLPQQPMIAPSAGAATPGTLAAAADGLATQSASAADGERRRWLGRWRWR